MGVFDQTPRELQRKLKALETLNTASIPYKKIVHFINKELFVPVTIAKVHSGQYVERVRIHNS